MIKFSENEIFLVTGGSSGLGKAIALKINEFSISFILVAISTSLPEAFVGVMSAIENTSALSLGNVLGSSIIDMTLIMGLSAVLAKNIKIESKSIKGDIFSMLLIAFLPLFLFFY